MAAPQLENGHTQIANEILEHLIKLHLPPNQWQVLLCIIRKTYGFHKKVDYIANSQIVEATGLCKAVVSRSLKRLEEMIIIIRNGKRIGFQKDWGKWQKLAEQSTLGDDKLVSSLVNNEKLAISSSKVSNSTKKVSSPAVAPSPPLTTPPYPPQKIPTKDTIQKILPKKKYGEFLNVLLTDEEYQKLRDKFGDTALEKIEALSLGIESKGYKYKNHYAAILSWERREIKGGQDGTTRKGNKQGIPGNRPAGAFAGLEERD